MSFVPTLGVHLDEDSYLRLMREAGSKRMSMQDLVSDIIREYFAEVAGAEEAARRLETAEPSISLDEMKRRLAC